MSKNVKTQIGFDADGYKKYLTKDEEVFNTYSELTKLTTKAIGDFKMITDQADFLESPFDYTLEIFWDKYCQNEPQHLDRELVFKTKTNISREQFNALESSIKATIRQMVVYAPKVSKTGLKSTINKDDFNIYLNENKKEEYDLVTKFMDTAIELHSKFNATMIAHVVRYHQGILLEGLNPVINVQYFKA
ncbi:hypothetical protein [Maribacter sp. ACAM166]|uniref:hypothetical protein n=1 Tax=Maribacter sp. ACAM166 TaxID=2508996 RepID=UPI0010FE9919|nr:hypothetical protein [Maribacter sp. ACAM166]TLP75697.1 hypothetical protein ES765_14750 [Maribacter sp. ACAM166]